VRQLAKDLQRCNGRWSPIYASNVEYRVRPGWGRGRASAENVPKGKCLSSLARVPPELKKRFLAAFGHHCPLHRVR
jgi:hypothetical protein